MEEVPPSLSNTRRVTFAMWWKLCVIASAWGFLFGFLGYAIPLGQLEFWFIASISRVLGPTVAEYLFSMPHAVLAAFDLLVDILGLVLLFFLMNWLVARHVGRKFGRFRLVLQRIQ